MDQVQRDYRALADSGLFDPEYYLRENSDVAKLGIDPLQHFIDCGWSESRNPNSLFDTQWYLDEYPDVAQSGINPLLHYHRIGGFIGRNPSLRFDSKWYLDFYPDVREVGVNPLSHYLVSGQFESRQAKSVVAAAAAGGRAQTPYDHWMEVNRFSARDRAELEQRLKGHKARLPKISVVTPVYDTDRHLLTETVDSVLNQVYQNWELCLVNDASPAAHIAPQLERFATSDPRIRVRHLSKNGGISIATNEAVEMATGDVVLFLDHDDLLTVDCLAEIALHYAEHPDVDMVYSDDDKIDVKGRRYAPQFKPDWSPVLLLSWMYIGHVFTVKRSLFLDVGGFRADFDGSQDYDFALRAAERVRGVGHVPKILYHWRAVEGSTATGGEAKPSSMNRGLLAVQEAIDRRGIKGAKAFFPDWAQEANVGMFDIKFADRGPTVTIIIPTKDQVGLLRNCIESIGKTTYRDFSILVVDNGSEEEETAEYLETLSENPSCRVVAIPNDKAGFSFARVNNKAVEQCDSEFVLFLNNDTQVITPGWLSQMMGYAQMPDVGAVGARLYFEDGTLQHAGIVHGYHGGLVGHAFRGLPPHNWGYLGFVRSAREYSAVTAACMLTPRALFEEVGGFDEENFAVAYNDVDYCYRLVQHGKTCVYCPTAELWHYEGKSRGFNDNPMERANFRRLYGEWVDRWYNPNLSLENEEFEVRPIRPATISKDPIRIGAFTHNLNNEGAPTTLMDLIIGMKKKGLIDPVIFSPADGPLKSLYEAEGCRVIILDGAMHGAKDRDTQTTGFAGIGMLLRALEIEVVIANTLQSYWAVEGSRFARIPSILAQHESEPWETYFDDLAPDMRDAAYKAFADAYRVLYVAEATRRSWLPVQTRRNFEVVRHGIPLDRLKAETTRWTRAAARKKLGVPAGAYVLSVVGTVCRRKGQLDLVKAYARLSEERRASTYVFIAGKIVDPEYIVEFNEVLDTLDNPNLVLTDHIDDPFLFYAASDIFVCTSLIESAPRVIVEAMACGLPIVTTPVFGIPELVDEGVNAVYYEPGDDQELAEWIERMLSDDQLRGKLAKNSPAVLAGQAGFAEMVDQYGEIVRQAVNLEIVD
ncbi:glycosyltransferase [Sphingomonas sp. LY29]|uniref:glycosyltransferase n=1 Tax=Sphingomonas sp. LY29 TaxID=3095341 RepID=UPI002D78FFB6|nr:glycosyltransferase [Sphingomonas sp. LY29]WRP25316.1 glycosyltransferase [Sphingomonas sp. LY29]